MRFQQSFSRIVNAGGGTTLGTDTVPTTPPSATADNIIGASLKNIDGFPVQRFVVTYKGPTNAQPLPAQLWMWEDSTAAWYRCGGTQMLSPGEVSWFDQPALGRMSANQEYNPGSLSLCLIVLKPAVATADPDGTYTFAMGVDISNSFETVLAAPGATLAEVTVGVAAVAMSSSRTAARAGLWVHARSSNTASIWVGDVDVAVGRGTELFPGDRAQLKGFADASRVFAVSALAGQKASGWLA
jgi:hypothetical protein